MKRLLFLIVTGIMILPACDSERATYEQCRTIFDHLVALELTEMGFEDPILTQQRQLESAYRYRKDIESCVGRQIPPDALECVLSAKSAEDVSHHCLR